MRYFLIAGAALIAPLNVQAQAQTFPGARLEVVAGWDHVRGKASFIDTAFPEDNLRASESSNGMTFGATAGYDIKLSDGLYAGIEAGIDFADNKRCEEVFGNDAACFKLKRNLAVGGRLGARLTARSMIYAGAAYVNGRGTVSYTDNADSANNWTYSDNRDGFRLSGGVEYRLSGNMYVKGEYRYLDYHNYSASAGTQSVSLGFDRHQIVGGVGVRF